MKRVYPIFCLLCFVLVARAQNGEKPYVLLVSMDGFRWDYPDYYPTPNLDEMAAAGVKAKSLKPCFPTKTFPNHYSMVTGLYPDHHGIVANHFYNPVLQAYFSIGDSSKYDPRFYGGQPIWCVLQKNHIETAAYFWPGSDVPIGGLRPNIWKWYDSKVPFLQRIDSVVAWFNLPKAARPHFVMLYFNQPDLDGHNYGPMSPEVKKTVQRMDALLGVLRERLAQTSVGKRVNVILLSDHGMASISNRRKIDIGDIPAEWVATGIPGSPLCLIQAAAGARHKLKRYLKKRPHTHLLSGDHAPARLHYGTNPSELDFTLLADLGWSFVKGKDQKVKAGNHGYDNRYREMHAIFYAVGPAFKKNYRMGTFENVDVFPLILHIFGLTGPKTDGDLRRVKRMLCR